MDDTRGGLHGDQRWSSRIRQWRYLVQSDLWRYENGASSGAFWRHYLRTAGFKYTFWHRTWNALDGMPGSRLGFQQFVSWRLRSLAVRYGISLPPQTVLGPGFYIGHYGGIVVHPSVRFGRDCNLSQGVTIGLSSRGDRFGCPTIGDRVYIGPGAKIFGDISIGHDAAIGANSVVTRSVPDSAVAVGMPARAISSKGSAGYIVNTGYEWP